MKNNLWVIFVISCIILACYKVYGQDTQEKDPFVPPFVSKEKGLKKSVSPYVKKPSMHYENLDIRVQGIIVGSKFKQAIIDDELYREGDRLKDMDAKIVKIEKGVVSIMFNGVLYEKPVEK